MMDRFNATMVEQAIPQGCRTLCQHPGCGVEIEQCIGTDEWVHIDSARPDHWATPVAPEPPEFTRQALERPSSLVDFLLESAKHHGVAVVTSTETYRAAERFAAGLLQTLTEGGIR